MDVNELVMEAIRQGATTVCMQENRVPLVLRGPAVLPMDCGAVGPEDLKKFLAGVGEKDTFGLAPRDISTPFGRLSLRSVNGGMLAELSLCLPAQRLAGVDMPYAKALVDQVLSLLRCNCGGLFLITGPTASGRTTALHKLMLQIAERGAGYMVSLQRPIEYLAPVSQQGMPTAIQPSVTGSFGAALRDVGRAQIVFVDGLASEDDIKAAITTADRGHIVIASLCGPASTVTCLENILLATNGREGEFYRVRLARVIKLCVAQKLLWADAGPLIACEVMVSTPAIQNLIREDKTYRITSAIQTGHKHGMNLFDEHLVILFREGKISLDQAITAANSPEDMRQTLKPTTGEGEPAKE